MWHALPIMANESDAATMQRQQAAAQIGKFCGLKLMLGFDQYALACHHTKSQRCPSQSAHRMHRQNVVDIQNRCGCLVTHRSCHNAEDKARQHDHENATDKTTRQQPVGVIARAST